MLKRHLAKSAGLGFTWLAPLGLWGTREAEGLDDSMEGEVEARLHGRSGLAGGSAIGILDEIPAAV